MKVEKICTERYLEILVASITVFANDKALFLRLGSSVHHFEHVINKKRTFLPKWLIIKPFRFYQKKLIYQIFLKIHEILPKVKLFTKSGHTGRNSQPKIAAEIASSLLRRGF